MTPNSPPDNSDLSAQESDLQKLLPALLGDSDAMPIGYDIETYMSQLEQFECSESEKRAFIHTVWRLLETVIGIRFGVDPATLELKAHDHTLAAGSEPMLHSARVSPPLIGTPFSAASAQQVKHKGGVDEVIQT